MPQKISDSKSVTHLKMVMKQYRLNLNESKFRFTFILVI